MAVIASFKNDLLEEVVKQLAEQATGTELSRMFDDLGLRDDSGESTKWRRIFSVLTDAQRREGNGTRVAVFVERILSPVRFKEARAHEEARVVVNRLLVFHGLFVNEAGKLQLVAAAKTLNEAAERASRLRAELTRRKIHPDVLRFCRAELLADNYFHAVFEATKSVADKIRTKAGLTTDGNDLVDQAFGLRQGMPRLAFNSLVTETQQTEHKGLGNLLRGLFGTFRNVTAHAPRITWTIEEDEALELLTITSYLHRRLDACVPTGAPAPR